MSENDPENEQPYQLHTTKHSPKDPEAIAATENNQTGDLKASSMAHFNSQKKGF